MNPSYVSAVVQNMEKGKDGEAKTRSLEPMQLD